MGIAFASSLLGLAGSLDVGRLELFASHGQNRFYRELEEWLSTITRVGFATDGEGGIEQSVLANVVDQMTGQMESLHTMFAQAEANRAELDQKIETLADGMLKISAQMQAATPAGDALARLADSQERLIHSLETHGSHEGIDAESRMRLRSIDVQMLRILEEISAGRQETMSELRTDLSALGRALAQGMNVPTGKIRKKASPEETAPEDGKEG
jgi:cell division protein FtsB